MDRKCHDWRSSIVTVLYSMNCAVCITAEKGHFISQCSDKMLALSQAMMNTLTSYIVSTVCCAEWERRASWSQQQPEDCWPWTRDIEVGWRVLCLCEVMWHQFNNSWSCVWTIQDISFFVYILASYPSHMGGGKSGSQSFVYLTNLACLVKWLLLHKTQPKKKEPVGSLLVVATHLWGREKKVVA